MTASLLGASFEAFVLDNEMLSSVYRALRGIEVNEETLGYDAIVQSVLGDGHFLGSSHTFNAMERDYFYPKLADRDAPITWAEKGAPDIWQRARDAARGVLASHHPDYLSQGQIRAIKDRFPILPVKR